MKLVEYMAKAVFEAYRIPTVPGIVVEKRAEVENAISDSGLTYPVVVKAQVQTGGRGKAGGIRFADTSEEAVKHCYDLLGSELKGLPVRQVLVVEKADYQEEWYLSIMLDRLTKCPMLMFSSKGGMDIEQTAKESPEAIVKTTIDPLIGFQPYMAQYMLSRSGLSSAYAKELAAVCSHLYDAFMGHHCLLCEINPLVVKDDGTLLALDSKVEIDDSALYLFPEIQARQDADETDTRIKEAREFRFLYIPVEADGTIAVMSNGSGMLMSCIDLISKENMKVAAALDLGGGATADRIKEAIRILFSVPGVDTVLVNIFGGITRCDEVAGGIKMAMEKEGSKGKRIVLRMEGTNKEKGIEIINFMDGGVTIVPGLRESVQVLVDRRNKA